MSNAKKILSAYALSYLRFSSVIQGKGDSSTRQNASRDRWLEAHPEIPLKREMNDLGLSAFSGKHVAQGDLGDFLALCESKEFRAECARRDVYLLVENLDRLSRERILKALAQLQGILESGVKVVTLCDGKTYDSKSLDSVGEVMMAVCAMARAYEESLMKSIRISSAWMKRRKQAAEEGRAFSPTSNPAWIRVDNGKMKTIPEAVKIVRRVFDLACEGKGITTIARILNNEGIPSLNSFRKGRKSTLWSQSIVKNIIQGRKVLGEMQFHKFETDEVGHPVKDKQGRRKRIPAGDPVKDYFPAIIDPATRAKANKIIIDRPSRGKTSKQNLNLFGKIAFDRKTGEPIYVRSGGNSRGKNGQKCWQYVPAGVRKGARGGKKWVGWKLEKLFFATISQALKVEGSVAGAEADLALAEEQLEDVQASLRGLEEFLTKSLRDKNFDPSGMREQMTAQQKVLRFKKEEIEQLKETIHAGAGAIRIDPDEGDRAKLIEVIRANVERIDLDCDKQEFRCVLMNGIEYEVKKFEGAWEIESKHFDTGAAETFTPEQLLKLKKKAA